ncbi:hypothetical protein N9W21_03140 [Shewanella sp.]|nr:hypothetical protein [Shewanella sp.]
MAKLFLLPLLISLLWVLFLRYNGIPLAQGKKGFMYIIGISLAVIITFSVLLMLTAKQNMPL